MHLKCELGRWGIKCECAVATPQYCRDVRCFINDLKKIEKYRF